MVRCCHIYGSVVTAFHESNAVKRLPCVRKSATFGFAISLKLTEERWHFSLSLQDIEADLEQRAYVELKKNRQI